MYYVNENATRFFFPRAERFQSRSIILSMMVAIILCDVSGKRKEDNADTIQRNLSIMDRKNKTCFLR